MKRSIKQPYSHQWISDIASNWGKITKDHHMIANAASASRTRVLWEPKSLQHRIHVGSWLEDRQHPDTASRLTLLVIDYSTAVESFHLQSHDEREDTPDINLNLNNGGKVEAQWENLRMGEARYWGKQRQTFFKFVSWPWAGSLWAARQVHLVRACA